MKLDDFEEEEEEIVRKPSSLAELKRKQTTAVVLLGVIGAEFGQDISTDCMYHINTDKIFSRFFNFNQYKKHFLCFAQQTTVPNETLNRKGVKVQLLKVLVLATII